MLRHDGQSGRRDKPEAQAGGEGDQEAHQRRPPQEPNRPN